MPTSTTCKNCYYYDGEHQMCPMFTVDLSNFPAGKVYLKRLPESPACQSKYLNLEQSISVQPSFR